ARRLRLEQRVAPYLREASRSSRLLREPVTHTPFPTLERLLTPFLHDVGRLLEKLGSTTTSIRARLLVAGEPVTLEQFRVEQMLWSTLSAAAALLLALPLGALGGVSAPALLALVLLCGVGGAVARDHALSRMVRQRRARLLEELPDTVELLALAVAAGEGILAALNRVARTSDGALSAELRRCVAETRSGVPLALALERVGARTDAPAVARFTEAVAVALDRGTPLADVLRAQSQDARESSRRELMEAGGRKEMAMMVPVVFLILPITVLFAIFPGLAVLQVGM
ncbi:type II secretion system F family protein, partial [Georgenia sp. 10Sc9-8]|nr:type II secretion system F family protein [Georgenia halotolerans]